jgi:peptidoglycan/xylan/chitin deacetylase (PgdA/CDA1 family)
MHFALTIDAEHPDRPARTPLGNAGRILALLAERRVPATFFVQGTWARAFPDLAARIAADRHLVGSHSHSHCIYPKMTREGMLEDMKESREDLAGVGIDPGVWFRLPGGHGEDDQEILKILQEGRFRHVGWTVICGDWNGWSPGRIADAIIAEVERGRAKGVSIPVVHSWPDSTPSALERVLDEIASDVDFVRLDALTDGDVPWGVLR